MKQLYSIAVCTILVILGMIAAILFSEDKETSQNGQNYSQNVEHDEKESEHSTTRNSSVDKIRMKNQDRKMRDESENDETELSNKQKYDPMDKEQRIAKMRKVAGYLDELLENDPIDAIWSTEAMHNVKDTMAIQDIGDPNLVSVDCRSRMCRVELDFDGTNDKMMFLEKYGNSFEPWGPKGWLWGKTDESAELVVYFAKEGETMPRLPREL